MTKKEKSKYKEEKEQYNFDTKLDILKFTTEVQSRIKKDITSDFILAKLPTKDKQNIIDTACDGYFAKRLFYTIAIQNKNPETTKKIKQIGEITFDMYMTRCYLTANLCRNVDKNYLIEIIAGKNEETTENETEDENEKNITLTKIKNKLKRED